jgi:hypothetical protein
MSDFWDKFNKRYPGSCDAKSRNVFRKIEKARFYSSDGVRVLFEAAQKDIAALKAAFAKDDEDGMKAAFTSLAERMNMLESFAAPDVANSRRPMPDFLATPVSPILPLSRQHHREQHWAQFPSTKKHDLGT